MLIIDDFLSSYQVLKQHSLSCCFSDITNPVDGVVYPFINVDIPEIAKAEINKKLCELFGSVNINASFLRMSPEGVRVPHMAHTDISMGRYSLMLYLNDADGGTGILCHKKTGISYTPEDQYFVDIVTQDQNNPEAWNVVDMARMKQNRAAIFDANRYHCALPFGGFGSNQSNSRIVMTVFFDD